MPKKALKVVVEVKFRAVSCPGVHLTSKDDIYLSMYFMGQYRHSEHLPAVFPLLFYEKMIFEKIFTHAVDPGDITLLLEYETVRIELVQLIPPGKTFSYPYCEFSAAGDTLACFQEDARHFLFPEPKLVPSFSGVDQEVLMTRAPHFPGIAPMLEFSTKTTITECSAYAEVNVYPNVPMKPVIRRNRKCPSRPRTSSPIKKEPQTLVRKRGGRRDMGRQSTARSLPNIPRSQSLSPQRAGNTHRLDRLSLDSAGWDPAITSQPMLASWPGASHSALFTTSPLNRSSSKVKFSPTGRTKSLSSGLIGGISEADSSDSETRDPLDYHHGLEPSALWRSYREQVGHGSSHREWEEVHERVRGLLTTPKAVRRLVYGATISEVDQVLARKSISAGPP
ncbi:hypothetical protein Q5P01_008295 [Channa striata]|uniref:Spermatogenesis-associated protein 6 N-terminal domain-containing protein n=1 Tax=Channa striata TaxID=64152 RepID=A0AA88NA17_CHASR|nr:hypothetical protein Q5P01_008295 [Channa striata]